MNTRVTIGIFTAASAIHAAVTDIVKNVGPRFSVEELLSRPLHDKDLAIIEADAASLARAAGRIKGAGDLLGVETSVLKNLVQHPHEAAELHTTLANLAHVIAQKPNPFAEFAVESAAGKTNETDEEPDDRCVYFEGSRHDDA
jgi:hypothetical protein